MQLPRGESAVRGLNGGRLYADAETMSGVGGTQAPEVATPETMSRTLATFYAFGGAAGLFAVWGARVGGPRQTAIVVMAISALLVSIVIACMGGRWYRVAFHLPVASATLLIASASWLARIR